MKATIGLAMRPTPVERLARVSRALGADVWVKRDDLTGLGLSGTKFESSSVCCRTLLAGTRIQ